MFSGCPSVRDSRKHDISRTPGWIFFFLFFFILGPGMHHEE